MITQKHIYAIAHAQLARDIGCNADAFLSGRVATGHNPLLPGRRAAPQGNDDTLLKAACFAGGGALGSSCAALVPQLASFAQQQPAWLFSAANLQRMQQLLHPFGQQLAELKLFFLPAPGAEVSLPSGYALRWFAPHQLDAFRGDARFGEALAFSPSAPDMLAVAAYSGSDIAGMAGASADCEEMWQIGIDVLPAHRGRGLAAALTCVLARQLLRKGRLPFYGTALSHIASQRVAIRAGFSPAWAELSSCAVRP